MNTLTLKLEQLHKHEKSCAGSVLIEQDEGY